MGIGLKGEAARARRIDTVDCLIDISEDDDLSVEVELGAFTVVGILMPAAWTAASLTFLAGAVSGSLASVYDKDGNEYTVTADASQYIIIPPADLVGAKYLQVRSGTSGTPVAQTADRTLTLVVRPV